MDLRTLGDQIVDRLLPGAAPEGGLWVLLAVLGALVVVVLPPLWGIARLGVTVVHELGHAVVGMLMGRRFTGFVVSADMSGHAVTVGPARGIGRVASTWAGYPAPAVVGTLLVQIALQGWAPTALFAVVVVLVLSLVFTRSGHTLWIVLVAALAAGALWWVGNPTSNAVLALAGGVFLLLGAWRHLGSVIRGGRRRDDPAQLEQLTPLPAWVWTLSFALVLAGCTWWAGTSIAAVMRTADALAG